MKAFKWFDVDTFNSWEEIKKFYKSLVLKMHPDKGGTHEAFVAMSAEYFELLEMLKNGELKFTLKKEEEREFDCDFGILQDILKKLPIMAGVTLELIGTWLWAIGRTYPYRERLLKIGFRYTGVHKAWYYKQEPKIARASGMSLDEIREKYGSENIKTGNYKQKTNPRILYGK